MHPEFEDLLHKELCDEIEQEIIEGHLEQVPTEDQLDQRARTLIEDLGVIVPQVEEDQLVRAILDRIVGLGPLQALLHDPTVTEIMVNDPAHIFVERNGKIERAPVQLRDEAHLRHIIERIVSPIGRRIDESSPLVDARLPDGSRVNAIIPPLALGGPALTIRKFSREPFTLEKLVAWKTINTSMAAYLSSAVGSRRSMIISGGTGSGKTTTLNALSLCIPEGERIITIEDSAELQLRHLDLVTLEARPPNIEGKGEIPIRTLVRNALRMRPDRIIVGEVRGGEAFDMLQAMNTGHRGSMTTLHANSTMDALTRLESMVLMAGFDLPLAAIQRMIAGAIEIVIQQDRLADGQRVITEITELMWDASRGFGLKPIFKAGDR
jgi:pilus assembly protein CpaF